MLPAVQALTTLVLLVKECMIDQTKEIVTLSHKHEKTKTKKDCWNLALRQRLCEANGIPMCNTGPSPLSHNCTIAVLTSSGSNHAQLKGALQCDHGGIQKR
jgi:hypothetical protein